jgi:hypothetical protein
VFTSKAFTERRTKNIILPSEQRAEGNIIMGPKGDEVRETIVLLIYSVICSGYVALAVDK